MEDGTPNIVKFVNETHDKHILGVKGARVSLKVRVSLRSGSKK